MVRVLISSESRFPINRKLLKRVAQEFLDEQKIKSEAEVSLSVVGDRKMRELNKKYRQIDQTTPVLSFGLENEKPFAKYPDNILHLGDIVISYPQVVLLAAQENKLVDQKITELLHHGLANLLGIQT